MSFEKENKKLQIEDRTENQSDKLKNNVIELFSENTVEFAAII